MKINTPFIALLKKRGIAAEMKNIGGSKVIVARGKEIAVTAKLTFAEVMERLGQPPPDGAATAAHREHQAGGCPPFDPLKGDLTPEVIRWRWEHERSKFGETYKRLRFTTEFIEATDRLDIPDDTYPATP